MTFCSRIAVAASESTERPEPRRIWRVDSRPSRSFLPRVLAVLGAGLAVCAGYMTTLPERVAFVAAVMVAVGLAPDPQKIMSGIPMPGIRTAVYPLVRSPVLP